MLIEKGYSKQDVFSALKHELHRGALDKKHPFRFVVLSTSGGHGVDSRYVVLRSIDEALHFFIFTDSRSEKINELIAYPYASLLFYHPQKRVQIRVQANSIIHQQNETAKHRWKSVQGEARKAYQSILPPGHPIHEPGAAFSWNENLADFSFFSVIELIPTSIELLQLNGLEHLRIRFTYSDGDWTGQWLAP
ncbi:MAG: pyridoxamine 5'-phosphate oxidase family protein [Cecembia sp.]